MIIPNKVSGFHLLGDVPPEPQYTTEQLINLSHADLLNIIAQDQSELDYINQDLATNATFDPAYQYDPATLASIQQVKMDYQVQIAVIQAWLNLSTQQQGTTNPSTFFQQQAQQFMQSYQSAINYAYGPGGNPSGQNNTPPPKNWDGSPLVKSGFDLSFLSAQYFGIPLWIWLGGGAAAYYALSK